MDKSRFEPVMVIAHKGKLFHKIFDYMDNVKIVIIGSDHDLIENNKLLHFLHDSKLALKAIDFSGQTSFYESMGILMHCKLFIVYSKIIIVR